MSDARPPKPDEKDQEHRFKELKRQYLPDDKPTGNDMASAGIELGMIVLVFALLGWWADKRFATTPWLTLVCCFVGIFGGLYRLVKKATRK